MTIPKELIVIVGPGRTGTSLARLWQDAGHTITGFVGGSPESHQKTRAVLGTEVRILTHPEALGAGTLVVLAVPDDRIDTAVKQILEGPLPATPPLVIHVAGARGRDALAPLHAIGIPTGAVHPLRAFPTREPGPRGLSGALCAIECDDTSRERLAALARDPGGMPVSLAPANRALYHAAAAIAGNAPVALLDVALRAFEKAGVPPALALPALVDLAKGALDNAISHGPAAALTGPVVRGDKAVVVRHLEALDEFSPVDARFYAALVRAQIRLASQREDGWKAWGVGDVLGGTEP